MYNGNEGEYSDMKAIKLRTEQKVNPIGIDGKEQFLSWICEDGISQSAYQIKACLLYTSPSPRDRQKSRMPSSA